MSPSIVLLLIIALAVLAFQVGKARAITVAGGHRGIRNLHSLPGHYGLLTAMWCAIPALVVFVAWVALQDTVVTRLVLSHLGAAQQGLPQAELSLMLNDLRNVVAGSLPAASVSEPVRLAAAEFIRLKRIAGFSLAGIALGVGILGLLWVRARIRPDLRARNEYERLVEWALFGCSAVAVLTTIGIVLSIVFEAGRFFSIVPFTEFFFGTNWSPQMAIRADQVGSSGAFGAVPLFVGTLLISLVAMVVAVPLGLFSAIYLAEYAAPRVRRVDDLGVVVDLDLDIRLAQHREALRKHGAEQEHHEADAERHGREPVGAEAPLRPVAAREARQHPRLCLGRGARHAAIRTVHGTSSPRRAR